MEEELATTSLESILNSTSNSPVVPRRLSCQIFDNQHEAETSANVNKHWKTRAKGNDVITNVISANQHFASTFSMEIFKFQRRSCKLSFLLPQRFGELARRLLLKDPSAPITTGVVSISIFHLLALSVHIIRPPSLFLGRTGHDRLELQFWIPNSSVDVNTLFFQLPQKLISLLLLLPLPFYITLVLQELLNLPLLWCDPLQVFFWGFSAMSQQQSRSLET